MRRLTVVMPEEERQMLQRLADKDMRPAREHIRFLIRQAALNYGLLPSDDPALAHAGAKEATSANATAR